jgi:hypothetical protein
MQSRIRPAHDFTMASTFRCPCAQSQRSRCGRDEPSPGTDVAGASLATCAMQLLVLCTLLCTAAALVVAYDRHAAVLSARYEQRPHPPPPPLPPCSMTPSRCSSIAEQPSAAVQPRAALPYEYAHGCIRRCTCLHRSVSVQ